MLGGSTSSIADMKQILLFITFFCGGFACVAQVISDLTLNGLKGAVEYCETTAYAAIDQFGEINYGDVIRQSYEEYDTKGFITRCGSTDNEYSSFYVFVNSYNPSGNIEVIDRYDQNGKLVVRQKFVYTVGKAVETVYGNIINGSTGRQGDIIWTKGKKVDNVGLFKPIYYYDAYNRLIKYTQKNIEGGDIITTYTYNNKGALSEISSTLFILNSYYSNYKYDEKGNWILRVEHNFNGNAKEIEVRNIIYRP